MNKLFTYTGVSAEEIPSKLAEPFDDPKAYKGVPGGADLTDINTGHMIERVTEVFGPKGLGWNLTWDPDMMSMPEGEKRATAHLRYAIFRYILWDEAGNAFQYDIPTGGVNTNSVEYAEEGARTSALGAALKGLCFQLPVYKGHLNHHNQGAYNGQSKNGKPKAAVVDKTPKGLVALGKELGLADGKEVTAALLTAKIEAFDPEKWDQMVKAVERAAEVKQSA